MASLRPIGPARRSESPFGDNIGVSGLANFVGVRGQATVDGVAGVVGENSSTLGLASGVLGELTDPSAVGVGVRGVAANYGVQGESPSVGVLGLTDVGVGVYGRGRDGVLGDSQQSTGLTNGVFGTAQSTAGRGVYGRAGATSGQTSGVYGEAVSTLGRGVYGVATATAGVTYGVLGQSMSTAGRGVRGEALSTTGTNYGVQGRTHSISGFGLISFGSSGSTGQKNFIQPHPSDPSKEIHFTSLEGNESGTYFRGTDFIVNGVAAIPVPEEFRLVTSNEGLTVQLTPIGAPGGLWIEARGLDYVIVRYDKDIEFDYVVNGVRRGFEERQPIHENHSFVPELRGIEFGTQYPEAYRQILVENGILNPDYTPNEVTAATMGWTLAEPIEPELREESEALRQARTRAIATPGERARPIDQD